MIDIHSHIVFDVMMDQRQECVPYWKKAIAKGTDHYLHFWEMFETPEERFLKILRGSEKNCGRIKRQLWFITGPEICC